MNYGALLKIGNGAGDFQNSMATACGQAQFVDGQCQQSLAARIQFADGLDVGIAQIAVEFAAALLLQDAALHNSPPHCVALGNADFADVAFGRRGA